MELVDRAEGPELYVLVEELAAALHTAAPTEIYLTADMGVTLVADDALGIGAPLLATTTVSDLRALIAKELAQAPRVHGFFARLFSRAKKDEALPAEHVVSADALEHALAWSATVTRFYETYAGRDVPMVLAAGGVPTDMATALAKRVAPFEGRLGAALVDLDLDAFLVTEALERASLSRRAVRHGTWDELLTMSIAERAALVKTRYPACETLALLIAVASPRDLATLLAGALLESGAQVVGWLGEPSPIFAWRGVRVVPDEVIADPAELLSWIRELDEAPAASGIVRTQRTAISAAS